MINHSAEATILTSEILQEGIDTFSKNYPSYDVYEWSYFRSFSGAHFLRLSTEQGELIIRFVSIDRAEHIEHYEYALLSFLAENNFPSARMIATTDGKVLTQWEREGILWSFVVYEFVQGIIHNFNEFGLPVVRQAFETIASFHHTVEKYQGKSDFLSYSPTIRNILNATDDQIHLLIQQNYNGASTKLLKEVLHQWRRISEYVIRTQEYIHSHQDNIIHGDLSPTNMVHGADKFVLIDFYDSGFAGIDWDIAIAISRWFKWQERFSFGRFYQTCKQVYTSVHTSVDWHDELLIQIVQVAFMEMMVAGLLEANSEQGKQVKVHLIETGMHYLRKVAEEV